MVSGGVLLGNLGGIVLACSRLSDSGEDAKVKGTRKVGGAKKGKPLLYPVSSRFTFVLSLSLLSRSLEQARVVPPGSPNPDPTISDQKNDIFHTRFQTRPLNSMPDPKCIVFVTFSAGRKQKSGFMLAAVSLGRKITIPCFLSGRFMEDGRNARKEPCGTTLKTAVQQTKSHVTTTQYRQLRRLIAPPNTSRGLYP